MTLLENNVQKSVNHFVSDVFLIEVSLRMRETNIFKSLFKSSVKKTCYLFQSWYVLQGLYCRVLANKKAHQAKCVSACKMKHLIIYYTERNFAIKCLR